MISPAQRGERVDLPPHSRATFTPASGSPGAAGYAGTTCDATSPPHGPHPLDPLLKDLAELRQHLSHYIAARADAAKLRMRTVVMYALLGLVGGLAGAVGLATAVVLLVSGISDGLTQLFGGRVWAGELTTGVLFLLLAGAAIWAATTNWKTTGQQRTIAK